MPQDWHTKNASDALKSLGSNALDGLTCAEAKERLGKYGRNELSEAKKKSALVKFISQFAEFITLVLIGSAVIAAALGNKADALAIAGIVVLNGVIGFLQEEKAAKVIEELKKLSRPLAKVLRDKELLSVSAELLVPGDIVIIEAGDFIPADCRLIEVRSLRLDESALTGESSPVDKTTEALANADNAAEQLNMAFSGTKAVYGRGRCVVTATGMSTEIGSIAAMLEGIKAEPTPLQKSLAALARLLVYGALAICAVIFIIGMLRGENALNMFLTAVSLAVAAIPEGLPAVVAITLSLGVQRMSKRHALIRKLPSVETLGSADVIASDKTGTLTQNQMTVKKIFLSATGSTVNVTGAGYAPEGEFFINDNNTNLPQAEKTSLEITLLTGLLCASAEIKKNNGNQWFCVGDPTEGALITAAKKAMLTKDGFTLLFEEPFDSERKLMTTVYKNASNEVHAFVKGAPESIISRSAFVLGKNGLRPLTANDRQIALAHCDEFASEGLRIVALATRSFEKLPENAATAEEELVFLGLCAMRDPVRAEAPTAVKIAHGAGIVTIMITGDHKLTAIAVAKEAGIFKDNDTALTGEELDLLGDEEFSKLLSSVKVYARVSPSHKLRIIRAWKASGHVIAMTGDGVNDAPALKEADIGVAMGLIGTDVAKEASDMVLTDDNFASIVSAVEEGRAIFENIKKTVHYLLSCNLGEILIIFVASVAGMPLPLLPIQILWTNLVTDGLPAIGLAMEPASADIMEKKPRRATDGIISRASLLTMFMQGAFIALCTLSVYAGELYLVDSGTPKARTMAFMTLVFCQNFHIFNCRDLEKPALTRGIFSNRMLNIAVGVILISQLLIVYLPRFQPVFNVEPLTAIDWAIVFAVAIQPLVWMEVVKRIGKR
ncbi:cation-translocating P-type ATPase [bacterium]|nr:MAG: cation-translocating P-type ATPase [bacterium]